MRYRHQGRRAQAVIVEMMLGVPCRIEAGGLGGNGLFDGIVDDLLRGLVIAALLRQNEYAEFPVVRSSTVLRFGPCVAASVKVTVLRVSAQLAYSEHLFCRK